MKYSRHRFASVLALTWSGALGLALAAPAGTVVVDPDGGGDYLNIQSALDWAADGDEIHIVAGTYHEALEHTSGKNFTLQPLVDGDIVELVGDGGASPVLTVSSSIFLKNMVLSGSTPGPTVGILCIDGILSIQGCTFDSFASRGVSLQDDGYHLYCRDNVFSNNQQGLVIANTTGPVMADVWDCEFTGNGAAHTVGSAIFVGDVGQEMPIRINIIDSSFVNNIGASGAAGYVHNIQQFYAYGCRFIGNTSVAIDPGHHGGALAIREQKGESCYVSHSTFVGNSMGGGGKGGAIAVWTSSEEEDLNFWLRYSVLSGNSADGGGGAVHVDVFQPGDYRINIEDSQLIGNSTPGDGGGLLVESVEGVDLTDTYFCANLPNPAAGYFNDETGNTFVDTCSAGACCVDGACGEMTESACELVNGIWIGAGTNCVEIDCSEAITGACCLVRFCDVLGGSVCNLFGGEFHPNKTCSEVACEPPPFCPGDVNFDGQVAIEDLLDVIGNWGSCF